MSAPTNHLSSVARTRRDIDEQGFLLVQSEHKDIVSDDFLLEVSDGDSIRLHRYRHRKSKDNQPALMFHHGDSKVAFDDATLALQGL